MSRIVHHFMKAIQPVEPGSIELWTNGTHNVVLPSTFNKLRIRMTGGGGGGNRTDGVIGGAGGAYGTAGTESRIDALGMKATGGQGKSGNTDGGAGGVGTGGDVNGTGTVGWLPATPTRGVPVPSLGTSGYGSEKGGGGAGYVEKTFDIGDPLVLPNATLVVILGKAGQNSITPQGFGVDGGCVIDWW